MKLRNIPIVGGQDLDCAFGVRQIQIGGNRRCQFELSSYNVLLNSYKNRGPGYLSLGGDYRDTVEVPVAES